jgi:GNAT superfamily N-acetyltransferase
MKVSWRFATEADLDLLARWNHQLIQDEGHRNPMTVPELGVRMKGWIAGEYRAVIFSCAEPVAYALYKPGDTHVHLRQLFVRRDQRRKGIGRSSFELLRRQVWPANLRLTVDALCANQSAIAFWRALGYKDYSLTLEIAPR